MSAIIMACDTLLRHIEAAQKKAGTTYEVVELDSKLHADPDKMNEAVFDTMEQLPAEADTVLMAMGLCGGSVSDKPLPRRMVIPKVDDCITMLLHRDENWYPNLKEGGHLYLSDTADGYLSVENIQTRLVEQYGQKRGMMVFDMWFKSYKSVDIIDTGVYDCHSDAYVETARRNADLIQCPLAWVSGSNLLLEKLVAGIWDHQFLIGEKGQVLTKMDFIQ